MTKPKYFSKQLGPTPNIKEICQHKGNRAVAVIPCDPVVTEICCECGLALGVTINGRLRH